MAQLELYLNQHLLLFSLGLRVMERLFRHWTASWRGGNHPLDTSLEAGLEANAERDLVLLLHLL